MFVPQAGVMDDYDDIDIAPVFMPGVDLALWLRIILVVIAVIAAATAIGVAI